MYNATSVFVGGEFSRPDDDHLLRCWKHDKCGFCLADKSCGWCPESKTCVPVPGSGLSLLAPVRNHPPICPLSTERWELRTSTFGCECSTTTLVAAFITFLCTITGLLVLWGLVKLIAWARIAWKGARGGYFLHVEEDETRWGEVWVRKLGWKEWWVGRKDQVLDPENGSAQNWWMGWRGGNHSTAAGNGEQDPLLSS
ncbi:hypothetical protein K402DRAFT_389401 [Aulographum hederae CBS 113979]|uniref:PSI domain-containing protein n=1 Tax=Aulographum hederae CBS 113979 TaxID=1176131 RepID=A0A6G1HE58_9PEZI|nr:hypothetical protein K402DRAFT_389401 [Aulographum hederae CBS 113979]